MSFNLEIVSPVKMVFQGEVKSVTIPGTLGSFQVLQNHAPLISTFIVGKIKVDKDSESMLFATSGGVFEVKNNKAIILADSIESKEDIDIERARLSKIRAEEILKISDSSVKDKEEAKLAVQRAENRIKSIEN
ncbi:MAG: ATP synthase F1 subunit epsilon [Ignavibacteria bacterium]